MDSDTLVTCRDLHFSYPSGRTVLRGVDLTISAGERVLLAGKNGSGKSTLLHAMLGLIKISSGEIEILGKRRQTERDFQEIRGPLGLLFQDSDDQLFCPTVFDELAFGPRNQGLKDVDVRAVVEEVVQATGLCGYEDRVPYRLSGGEKRLLALASILTMRPRVLLLDEPETGLDEESRARLLTVLRASPAAMLVITHEPDFAHELCERGIQLADGEVSETRWQASS